MHRRRAVFLDRDGVINRNVLNPTTGAMEAPLTVAEFAVLPGVPEALRRLPAAEYLLFVVSNQPNVAKGKSTLEELLTIDARLRQELDAMRVRMAAVYYCLHHPQGVVRGYAGVCACRKPSPYFLQQAAGEFGIDLARSWMVGDRKTDVECGRAAGVRTALVGGAYDAKADWVGEGLAGAVSRNLEETSIPCLSASLRDVGTQISL